MRTHYWGSRPFLVKSTLDALSGSLLRVSMPSVVDSGACSHQKQYWYISTSAYVFASSTAYWLFIAGVLPKDGFEELEAPGSLCLTPVSLLELCPSILVSWWWMLWCVSQSEGIAAQLLGAVGSLPAPFGKLLKTVILPKVILPSQIGLHLTID